MVEPDWRPTAPLALLKERARILAGIRAFFAQRQVLEVETPLLSVAATTDPALASFAVSTGEASSRYLQTSPEFSMKRLLAAGSGPIYQIARVFRQGERGSRHNPEFTLLEWYRPGFDLAALMSEVEVLIRALLAPAVELAETEYQTYGGLFRLHLGLDPHTASNDDLRAIASRLAIDHTLSADEPHDHWLDLLLTHVIEPQLGRGHLCFVHDYPASQAALAQIRPGPPPVAERFEVYLEGIELANGFHELADAAEQYQRFIADNRLREENGLPSMPLDESLLAALESGLPDCSGVAVGVDRLVMQAVGASRLDEVIAFPWERA